MNRDVLTAIFTRLGAPDPESWARSQDEEGINQLGRFLFLKGAWSNVVDDDDTSWIDRTLERTPSDGDRPFDGVAYSLTRLMGLGADKQDINQLVREMQVKLMFALCYLLDDASVLDGNDFQSWALFEVDAEGEPRRRIGGLHESVLGTDPTGREMRPRLKPPD